MALMDESQFAVVGTHEPNAASASLVSPSSCFVFFCLLLGGGAGDSSAAETVLSCRSDFEDRFFLSDCGSSFSFGGACGAPPILWWY